ncbi:hypothetical protein HZ326_20291 [Fusarium oxysporum f. sp. albedinis]|nr:hypothetical protein HZ326_20291 [Fusarium oxysporum f. sp. albedinis]
MTCSLFLGRSSSFWSRISSRFPSCRILLHNGQIAAPPSSKSISQPGTSEGSQGDAFMAFWRAEEARGLLWGGRRYC